MSLDAIFRPGSIAVIGASRDPAKFGYLVVHQLVADGFPGRVYPINPAGDEICGLAVSPRLAQPVDLALILLPAAACEAALRDCAGAGVKACIVYACGFAETGAEGAALERRLGDIARASGMRLVGPNGVGAFNAQARLNATMFGALPMGGGPIAFVSQSGALCAAFVHELATHGLAPGPFLSAGNMADVDYLEALEYFDGDPRVTAIALFVEGVPDAARFVEVGRSLSKPVVAFRGGMQPAGERASRWHTGSSPLAETWDVLVRDAGFVPAFDSQDLFDKAVALALNTGRGPTTDAVAILTISGGPAVIACDAIQQQGLRLATLSPATVARLCQLMPAFASWRNPVDMTAQIARPNYAPCMEAVLADPAVGGVLAFNAALDVPEFGAGLVAAVRRHRKPASAFVFGAPSIEQQLAEASIPNFSSTERAVRAYAAVVRSGRG